MSYMQFAFKVLVVESHSNGFNRKQPFVCVFGLFFGGGVLSVFPKTKNLYGLTKIKIFSVGPGLCKR